MEELFAIILVLLTIFAASYAVLIGFYTYGWFTLKKFALSGKEVSTKISVLVPARNEENNIQSLIEDLVNQKYPKNLLEIIIVDDHSEDDTIEIAASFVKDHDYIKILSLRSDEVGKKSAISRGVKEAKGELIVTTDADCHLQKNWLFTLVQYYEKDKPKFISSTVCFHHDKSFFKKLQSLEFLSLIASGAGSISMNAPVLCNGANLAYTKKAFEKVRGYESDSGFVSGDDVFLLLKIKKEFGNKTISFLKDYNALVFTEPKKSLKAFLQQRIRWISKSRGYKNLGIVTASLLVYLYNYMLFAGLIFGFWLNELLTYVFMFFVFKLIIDLPIYLSVTSFVKKTRLMLIYLPMQVLYVFYVSIIGFAGNFLNFSWKGRKGLGR